MGGEHFNVIDAKHSQPGSCVMELLKTMTYFRCLPPTESYQCQLVFVRSFQAASGTNGSQWYQC